MERQKPLSFVIVTVAFVCLAGLMALAFRCPSLSAFTGDSGFDAYGGLAVTFLLYLIPTIADVVLPAPGQARPGTQP
ncbi:MAG TPA: hypothetical protein VEC94_11155 [Pseudolabrys sp.]|jgi:hypothetical protein|nr:hypothetical protein [Pseudolabrys sp.]